MNKSNVPFELLQKLQQLPRQPGIYAIGAFKKAAKCIRSSCTTEVLKLVHGQHSNKDLQKIYNENNFIVFSALQITKDLESAEDLLET